MSPKKNRHRPCLRACLQLILMRVLPIREHHKPFFPEKGLLSVALAAEIAGAKDARFLGIWVKISFSCISHNPIVSRSCGSVPTALKTPSFLLRWPALPMPPSARFVFNAGRAWLSVKWSVAISIYEGRSSRKAAFGQTLPSRFRSCSFWGQTRRRWPMRRTMQRRAGPKSWILISGVRHALFAVRPVDRP